ncbi:MAG TPA: enoyl-CoA hydratase/isomerase family protein [Terriglobales bacterium]|nr:enoyl-CoA hydratase/isomerase family protein [Terriglobales bacterium]
MKIDTTTQLQRLTLDLEGPVARVTLSNPPLNVIDLQMMDELIAVMEQVERPGVTAVVIRGAGKQFSAGVDIAAHTPDKVQGMLVKFHSVIRAMLATPKITIAQVEGACLGGGAELALVCDMVYTARNASWAFPEIKLACFPPVAAAALASVVGPKRAAELIFTGRQISGDEALAIGLATRAARTEELESLVDDAVAHLDPLSSVALGLAKKAFYSWDSMHFDKGLARAEQIYLNELVKTADSVEGIQAWMEKRAPMWKGK